VGKATDHVVNGEDDKGYAEWRPDGQAQCSLECKNSGDSEDDGYIFNGDYYNPICMENSKTVSCFRKSDLKIEVSQFCGTVDYNDPASFLSCVFPEDSLYRWKDSIEGTVVVDERTGQFAQSLESGNYLPEVSKCVLGCKNDYRELTDGNDNIICKAENKDVSCPGNLPANSFWKTPVNVRSDGTFTQTLSVDGSRYEPDVSQCKFECKAGFSEGLDGNSNVICVKSEIEATCFDKSGLNIDYVEFCGSNYPADLSDCEFQASSSPYLWKNSVGTDSNIQNVIQTTGK